MRAADVSECWVSPVPKSGRRFRKLSRNAVTIADRDTDHLARRAGVDCPCPLGDRANCPACKATGLIRPTCRCEWCQDPWCRDA